jgi:hypothetical protein
MVRSTLQEIQQSVSFFSRFDSKNFIFKYLIEKYTFTVKMYTQKRNRKLNTQFVHKDMGIAELFVWALHKIIKRKNGKQR